MPESGWTALVDPRALCAWMDGEGLGSGSIEDAMVLTGGTQNLLLKFRRGARSYVLRRPPLHPGSNGDEAMRREARVLKALSGSAVPHPALIASCADASILGAAFYLMEPVDGFTPTGELPAVARDPVYQHGIGLAMVKAIASLSRIGLDQSGLEGFGKLDGYLERQVPRWRGMLDKYAVHEGWPGPQGLPYVAEVAAWLESSRPASFQPGLVHGDFHMGNVMFSGKRCELVAVVDWELATIGDPLIDLGWLVATWPSPSDDGLPRLRTTPWLGFARVPEIIAHYSKLSGRALDNLQWYVVLSCYKLGIILEGTHARACAGKADPHEGNALHQSAIWLFERARHYIECDPVQTLQGAQTI